MSLNTISIAGNLGDDPVVNYSGSTGEPVANFDLAFNCGKDKTGWIRCCAFKKTAEIVERFLHKGARVAITGSLSENSWVTDDNQKRKTTEIIVHNVEFIKTDGRGFENGQN